MELKDFKCKKCGYEDRYKKLPPGCARCGTLVEKPQLPKPIPVAPTKPTGDGNSD